MNDSIFTNTMADMNWKEVEEKGRKNIPVLFPIGVIEQHGPHLPLGNDIYFSYAVCRNIQKKAFDKGKEILIAPPYYWGINNCTSAFPGTFSLKPETMKRVLAEIFGNLSTFGFQNVCCMNYHGDSLHIRTILEAIRIANSEYGMKIKMLMEPYELDDYGLSGTEDFCLLDTADYPPDIFDEEENGLDIHAGAFECAAMKLFYPDILEEGIARQLPDSSLDSDTIRLWLQGGEEVRKLLPLGYAGNPAGYEKKLPEVRKTFDILCEFIADQI